MVGEDISGYEKDISDYEKDEDDFDYDAVATSMSTVYSDTNENSTDVDENVEAVEFFESKRRKMILDCSDAVETLNFPTEDAEAMSQPMVVRKSNSFC